MRASLLLLTACWTAPVPAPKPSPPIAGVHRACEIHATDVTPVGVAELSVSGVKFARMTGLLHRLDIAIDGPSARGQLETVEVVLDGDIDLAQLPVRTEANELHDNWLGIQRAIGKRAHDGMLELEVELPTGLDPKTVRVAERCERLTVAIEKDPLDEANVQTELVAGMPVRKSPGGEILATSTEVISVVSLEQRGPWVRVRIDGTNAIVGWVPKEMVKPGPGNGNNGFGFGRSGWSHRSRLTCAQDVPLYVTAGRTERRVGHLKANAGVWLKWEPSEVRADVDLDSPIGPYIKDLANCREGS